MTKKCTRPVDALALLQAHGQLESSEFAEQCGTSERALATQLYDSIVAGHVVTCKVERPGEKARTLYRWSGWIPPHTPGRICGSARTWAKAIEPEKEAA